MAQEIADSKLLDTWSSSGTKIEPDISKIIEGWQLGEQPPHEYMNWLQNTFGSKLNHILKNGVAKWNNGTEYLAGASVQHSGNVWICETTNINSEPTDLNANWGKVAINKDLTVPVDTLADLRSISYPVNTVWASGYHTKNDMAFGSHIFRLKGVKTTETDNGGTVIIASIGGVDYVYELQYDGAVNVKWFGAKGDGATDCSTIINNIISWQYTNNAGEVNIFTPNGIYRVDEPINFINLYGASLIGESMEKTVFIKYKTSTKSDVLIVSGLGNEIKNFTIIGESNTDLLSWSIASAINLKGIPQSAQSLSTKRLDIKNVKIQRADIGLQVGSYDIDSFDPDIETNRFEKIVLTEVGTGVFLNGQNVHNNPFYNCHFTQCRDACMRSVRGGWINVYNTYFGPLWNALTNSTVSDGSIKIKLEASSCSLVSCHSENQGLNKAVLLKSYANVSHRVLMENCRVAHGTDGVAVIILEGTGTSTASQDSSVLINNHIVGGWVSLENVNYVGIGNIITDETYSDGYNRVGNQPLRHELILDGRKLSDTIIARTNVSNTYSKLQNINAVSGTLAQYSADSAMKVQIYGTSAANSTQMIFESGARTRLKVKATDMMGFDSSLFLLSQTGTPATKADGGVIYVEAGALKFKGASGTITTIAPA